MSTLDQILSMAHVVNQKMRSEDLCGRLGHFQFVIVLSGNRADGEKLLERIRGASALEITPGLVQWSPSETSLELFYRLDRAVELAI
jgi:GGDEF domain-containing protein